MSKFIQKKSGKVCQISGKSAIKGWRYSFLRSHFNPTCKRRFEVNLQTVKTFDENGTPVKVKLSTSMLKRCPDVKLGVTVFSEKKLRRRLKGKKKQEEPVIQDEIQVEEFQPLDQEIEQILEQEEAVEEKYTDSLVEAVNEYLETKKEEPVLNKRDLKIKQKFNRGDDDLIIKY